MTELFAEIAQLVVAKLGALLLFSRREPPGPRLGTTRRNAILDAIRAEPGIPISELHRRIGLGWGPLYGHLEKLQAEDMIRLLGAGRRRIVFPARTERAHEYWIAEALLRGRSVREIATRIAREEATDIAALSRVTGLSPRGVSYHVRRLAEAGLIGSLSQTRYFRLCATPLLRTTLILQTDPALLAVAEIHGVEQDQRRTGASSEVENT